MASGRKPGIAVSLGLDFVEVEAGKVFTGTPGEHNPIGAVHGGYAATPLDSAFGAASSASSAEPSVQDSYSKTASIFQMIEAKRFGSPPWTRFELLRRETGLLEPA